MIWLVLTVAWAILATLPNERMVGFAAVEMGFAIAYDNPPGPFALYVDWMHKFLTLQWGFSVTHGQPVVDLYLERIPVTLAYVVPAVIASVLVGSGLTTYAATRRKSLLNRALSATSYVGLSVPAFLMAVVALRYMSTHLGWVRVYDKSLALWHPQNVVHFMLPAGILGLNFLAVQVRYAQTETAEYLEAGYVKTARAKGAGQLRTAVHVFRNSWPSLGSLVLGEAAGVLFLSMIVIEEGLLIPGIARAVFYGFAAGEPMVSFTAVFGIVFLGVVGTLARDFARLALDPRFQR